MNGQHPAPADAPRCLPPDPKPRAPSFRVPPRACDCHAHICGPAGALRLYPRAHLHAARRAAAGLPRTCSTRSASSARCWCSRASTAPTTARCWTAMQAAGREHARRRGGRRRHQRARSSKTLHAPACAACASTSSTSRPARASCRWRRSARLAERIAPFGWHIEFLMHVDEFPDLDRMLADLPVESCSAISAMCAPTRASRMPGFQALLRLLRDGRAWVKLTGPYRISTAPLPHADTNAFAAALLEAAPRPPGVGQRLAARHGDRERHAQRRRPRRPARRLGPRRGDLRRRCWSTIRRASTAST